MGLREQAELDLATTLEDKVGGFGFDISVTDPSGAQADLIGSSTDIALLIDPDTGQAVSGRQASVALRISSLKTAFPDGIPMGITDASIKPWLVKFNSINGTPYTFKVTQSNPDRMIGILTLILEFYKEIA